MMAADRERIEQCLTAQNAAHLHGRDDHVAGLHPLDAQHIVERRRSAFRREIPRLSADHAGSTGAAGEALDQPDAHRRVGVRCLRGKNLKGSAEQRITRKDRRGRVIGRPDAGLAAPQPVVVHVGQVVMHQRIGMYHFERRAGRHAGLGGHPVHAGHHAQQVRPQPLAAAQRPMPHGCQQPVRRAAKRAVAGTGQVPAQEAFDPRGIVGHLEVERSHLNPAAFKGWARLPYPLAKRLKSPYRGAQFPADPGFQRRRGG